MRRESRLSRPSGLPSQLWLLLALTGVAALALYVTYSERGIRFNLPLALGLAAAFFATRLLTIKLPQGDDVYVTLVVGLWALAISDISTALAASAVAGIVESVARYSQSSRPIAVSRALDALRATTVLGMLAPWQLILHPLVIAANHNDALIIWVVLAGMMYAGIDILTMAVQQRIAGGLPVAQGIAALQRPLVTMYLVHLAMVAVAIRLYVESGVWAFPIALLLTLILQNSFNLYLRIRRGYSDTISALAHAAELDRPQDSGHARRVADLAVAVGRRMGLHSHELERIGYAALLHDIGRMGEAGDDSNSAHAQRGAEIVASIPFLSEVAPLIDRHDEEAPASAIGADIVRMCSRYDRLRTQVGVERAILTLTEESGQGGQTLKILGEVVRNPSGKFGAVR